MAYFYIEAALILVVLYLDVLKTVSNSIADLLNIASIAEHCDSKNATIYANSQNLAFNPIKLAVSVVFEIKD